MPVPAMIAATLDKHHIHYSVIESMAGSANNWLSQPGAARSTVMHDAGGRVHIIHAASSLLDIDALQSLTGRALQAGGGSELDNLRQQFQLESIPGVPQALSLPTVIDKALLGCQQLTLDAGNGQSQISLSREAFQQLAEQALWGDIGLPEQQLQQGTLDNTDDVADITRAVANFTQLRIKQRLEETLEFPPLPETAQRIIKLRVDPNADIIDLSNIVETDPALAAQVISWAASPYYAAPGKIKSVHDAIVRVLGFDLVLNLALGLALGKTLQLPKENPKGFTPYWQQAVYAATAVEALVGIIPAKQRPEMGMAYLSGLLHNFGYLILAQLFPPQFSHICRFQEANLFSSHCSIERHLLGVTREQLGAWLMRLWNMPEEVCLALRYQHDARYQGEQASYANLLYIGMRLLRKHGIGNAPLDPIPMALYERLSLDPDKAEQVIDDVINSAADLNIIASNLAA